MRCLSWNSRLIVYSPGSQQLPPLTHGAGLVGLSQCPAGGLTSALTGAGTPGLGPTSCCLHLPALTSGGWPAVRPDKVLSALEIPSGPALFLRRPAGTGSVPVAVTASRAGVQGSAPPWARSVLRPGPPAGPEGLPPAALGTLLPSALSPGHAVSLCPAVGFATSCCCLSPGAAHSVCGTVSPPGTSAAPREQGGRWVGRVQVSLSCPPSACRDCPRCRSDPAWPPKEPHRWLRKASPSVLPAPPSAQPPPTAAWKKSTRVSGGAWPGGVGQARHWGVRGWGESGFVLRSLNSLNSTRLCCLLSLETLCPLVSQGTMSPVCCWNPQHSAATGALVLQCSLV